MPDNTENLDFIREYHNNKPMTGRMERYWLSKFDTYPEVVVIKALNEHIDTIGRWPKLHELYPLFKKHDNRPFDMLYNKDSDNRFPIGKLWEAFNLFHKKGQPEYEKFCEAVNMPVADRQRVYCKFQSAFDVKKLGKGILARIKEDKK